MSAVVPLLGVSSTLYNNYTLTIRWDYLLHALVYLPMPLLLVFYLKKRHSKSGKSFRGYRLWIMVLGTALILTVVFESVQIFIPYRRFNLNDMVANGVGVMLGLIPAILVLRRFSSSV